MARQKKNPEIPRASGVKVHCSYDQIIPIVELVKNPENPNHHPDKQVALLAKIISSQGWRAPITVSNRSGFIVRGHGRLDAAILLNVSEVPVDFQNYKSESEEWADLIADNRIAELSEINNSELKDMLNAIDTGIIDTELTGYMADELEELMLQTYQGPDSDAGSANGASGKIVVMYRDKIEWEYIKEKLHLADKMRSVYTVDDIRELSG